MDECRRSFYDSPGSVKIWLELTSPEPDEISTICHQFAQIPFELNNFRGHLLYIHERVALNLCNGAILTGPKPPQDFHVKRRVVGQHCKYYYLPFTKLWILKKLNRYQFNIILQYIYLIAGYKTSSIRHRNHGRLLRILSYVGWLVPP